MNMMLEVDVLFNKQVELKYLARIKKLLYLLAVSKTPALNVSRLADEVGTSRATVMNYLKYLEEARLINMVYREGESFPQKPVSVYLHDTNLIHAVFSPAMNEQVSMETFFVNTLWRHHTVNVGRREGHFLIDNTTEICVCEKNKRVRTDALCLRYDLETGSKKDMPIWLLGFLY
jgi:predicted AAA+ superfamily ATPase